MNLSILEDLAKQALDDLHKPMAKNYDSEEYYDNKLHYFIESVDWNLSKDEWKVVLKYFPDYIFFCLYEFSHELQNYALSFIKNDDYVMPGFSRYDRRECLESINNPSEEIINYYISEYLSLLPKGFKKNLKLKHFEIAFRNLNIKEILD